MSYKTEDDDKKDIIIDNITDEEYKLIKFYFNTTIKKPNNLKEFKKLHARLLKVLNIPVIFKQIRGGENRGNYIYFIDKGIIEMSIKLDYYNNPSRKNYCDDIIKKIEMKKITIVTELRNDDNSLMI